MEQQKIRVGLIYGGKSGEHEVSLSTAKAVIGEFDYHTYEIVPFYITTEGTWRAGPQLQGPVADVQQLKFAEAGTVIGENAQALAPLFGNLAHSGAGDAVRSALRTVDVVFPLLHGTFGEDGTIQGLLEMLNVPYVGAGVLASAVGMDKVAMKRMFATADLPQCVYRHFTRKQWELEQTQHIMEIEVSLGYPCFVKPANLGSSVGISKARDREQLLEAVQMAFQYDRKVIVEEFVDAREIEVSVLGNDSPRASVAGEIAASSEFYDYNAKYIDGKSVMTIPADLPPEIAASAREMAIRAFLAIDGAGLSRVDFFLRREDGQLLINEINTMPGFTPFSMYPLLWKATGVNYRALLDELLHLAMERHEEKKHIKYGMK
jgi:D-alanine-D-alanine ligase